MKNKKNKKEGLISKKEFLIIFLAILILSGISYWNFKKSEKALPFFEIEKKQIENLEIPDLPSFENPSLTPSFYEQYPFPEVPGLNTSPSFPESNLLPEISDYFLPQKEIEYSQKKIFISSDGKLKISYPLDWSKIEIKDFQKNIDEDLIKTYQMEILFIAQKFGTERFGSLNIAKMVVSAEMGKEQLLEKLKEIAKKQEIEMEIIDFEIKEKEITFKATYKSENQPIRYSKEKVIILEPENNKKQVFLVAITAWKTHLEDFNLQAEIKEIFSTLQVFE